MEPAAGAARAAICGVRPTPAPRRRHGGRARRARRRPVGPGRRARRREPRRAAGGQAGRPRDPPRAPDRLLGARARRGVARRRGDLAPRGDPQRVLPPLRDAHLCPAARLQGGRRDLPEAVGVGAVVHDVVRRPGPALQRPLLPELPPQGRARASRRGPVAGRGRHVDAVPGERAPRDGRRAPRDRGGPAGGRRRSRPTGRSSRASRSRGSRPRRGCGSRTRTVRSRSTAARSSTSSSRATGRWISGTGRCVRRRCSRPGSPPR